MLGIHCPECKVPLFQDPKTGTVSCPICGTEFEVIEEKEEAKEVERKAKERKKRVGGKEGEKKAKKVEKKKKPDGETKKQRPKEEKQEHGPELPGGKDVREVALQVVTARLRRAAEAEDPEHALRELEVAEKALEILKKL